MKIHLLCKAVVIIVFINFNYSHLQKCVNIFFSTLGAKSNFSLLLVFLYQLETVADINWEFQVSGICVTFNQRYSCQIWYLSNLPRSPGNTHISWFLVESLLNKHFHNSRTSIDIDMKLGPITKLGKSNTITSKSIEDAVMSTNYDFVVIFPIYSQLGAIRKSESGRMLYNS